MTFEEWAESNRGNLGFRPERRAWDYQQEKINALEKEVEFLRALERKGVSEWEHYEEVLTSVTVDTVLLAHGLGINHE